MISRIIEKREELLASAQKKAELLQNIIQHIEDIRSNDVFVEEVQQTYLEMDDDEASFITDKEIKTNCPECSYECAQIYSYCMVCGAKLNDDFIKNKM